MPRRLILVALAVAIPLGAASAFASSLSVTSTRLTSFSGPTSVPTSTCTLGAEADSYVSNALLPPQTNTNFGSETQLHVSGGATDKRSFLRFDLVCVPSTAEVKSATLRLVLATAPTSGRNYVAHLVSAPWAEGSITWSNQPNPGASSGTVPTGTTNGATLQWMVTADVQAFVNGTASNNGWRIADSDENNPLLSSQEGRFGSREGTGIPELEVVFHP